MHFITNVSKERFTMKIPLFQRKHLEHNGMSYVYVSVKAPSVRVVFLEVLVLCN